MHQPRPQCAATPVVHLSSSPPLLTTTTDKAKAKAIDLPVCCNVLTYCNALLTHASSMLLVHLPGYVMPSLLTAITH